MGWSWRCSLARHLCLHTFPSFSRLIPLTFCPSWISFQSLLFPLFPYFPVSYFPIFLFSYFPTFLFSYFPIFLLSFLFYFSLFQFFIFFPSYLDFLLVGAPVRDGCNPDRPRSFLFFHIPTRTLPGETGSKASNMSVTITSAAPNMVRVVGREAQPVASDNWKGRLVTGASREKNRPKIPFHLG